MSTLNLKTILHVSEFRYLYLKRCFELAIGIRLYMAKAGTGIFGVSSIYLQLQCFLRFKITLLKNCSNQLIKSMRVEKFLQSMQVRLECCQWCY